MGTTATVSTLMISLIPNYPLSIKNRSIGGTMILWKSSLDQFVTVLPKVSASFLAILFHPPGSPPSIHVSLYLPTSGKETQFIEELSKLRIYLEDLLEDHPDYLVYLRGDSNVNANNKARSNVFNDFKSNRKIIHVPLGHKAYHHFLGEGLFDSEIDVVIGRENKFGIEKIENIFCKHEFPFIHSHHDLISSLSSPNPTSSGEGPTHSEHKDKSYLG